MQKEERRLRNVQYIGLTPPGRFGGQKKKYEVHTDDDCFSHKVSMTEKEYRMYQGISFRGDDDPKWEKMQRFLRKKVKEIERRITNATKQK